MVFSLISSSHAPNASLWEGGGAKRRRERALPLSEVRSYDQLSPPPASREPPRRGGHPVLQPFCYSRPQLQGRNAKQKVQTRAMRGSAQSFIGKKPYLNLRLRAASDFFLRLTDGFS